MKKNFYLQHSLMAMNDSRMQHMVDEENLQGSGAYWFIIEKLALLPEPRAQMVFLEPHCKFHNISYRYVKNIILNYQLFTLEEDGYFTPVELNPVQKEEKKTTKKVLKKSDFEQKSDEIEKKRTIKRKKMVRKEKEICKEETSNTLEISNITQNDTLLTKDIIIDITTTTTTEEKEETAAAAVVLPKSSSDGGQQPPLLPGTSLTICDDFGRPQRPLRPVRPWQELADGLLNESSSWLEIAYLRSGYGVLLQRQLKKAIELFKSHIIAYGKGDEILEMRDMQRYFINFVNAGSRTSKILHETLVAFNAKECPHEPDGVNEPHRYEQFIDGQRTYQGCPIPRDAPPRPDETAFWDEEQHAWITGRKPPKRKR